MLYVIYSSWHHLEDTLELMFGFLSIPEIGTLFRTKVSQLDAKFIKSTLLSSIQVSSGAN